MKVDNNQNKRRALKAELYRDNFSKFKSVQYSESTIDNC